MKVFIAHSARDRDLAGAITTLLREDSHDVVRPDELAVTGEILSEISAAIRSADVVVAMITSSNPNVLYEVGLAAGASVPMLVTASSSESLPADLANVPFVLLKGDVIRDAQTIVRRMKDLQGLSPAKPKRLATAEATLRAASEDPAVLEALAPAEFERLVAELFKERGYQIAAAPTRHDTGVDLIIKSPKDEQILLVEVKKLSRQSRVSVEAVRKLLESVSFAAGSLGVLVSTAAFTAAALALAAGAPIVLRTLEELLAAPSKSDIVGPRKPKP